MRIATEAEYDAALAEYDATWAANPGTPEGRRLDELVDALCEYEHRAFPDVFEPPTAEDWSEYRELQQRREGYDAD